MRFDGVDDVLKVSGTAPGITKALFNFFRCVINDTIIGNVYVCLLYTSDAADEL